MRVCTHCFGSAVAHVVRVFLRLARVAPLAPIEIYRYMNMSITFFDAVRNVKYKHARDIAG